MTRTLPRAAVAVVLGLTLGGGGFVLGAAAQAAGVDGQEPVGGRRAVLVVEDRTEATRIETWSPAHPPLRAGHVPAADDEVAVDVRTALTRGIRLGQTVGVRGLAAGSLRVVGLVGGSPESVVVVSTSTARRLLGADAGR